jgi:acetylcholinesterase
MVQQLVDHYPADPTQGSPFNTGHLNQIGPMYKRIAAIIGDYTFISGRRATLDATYNKQNVWSYQIVDNLPLLGQSDLLNALHVTALPVLGSFHISDVVLYAFGTIPAAISKNSLNIMSSLITFANHHDPNVASSQGLDLPFWPKYNPTDRMQFKFAENGTETFPDDYRTAAFNFINDNREVFRG